ncbi:MAG TPA: CPBP family intramembrane glutamic endopeptidase, partial [Armatimonadota bacterium]
KADPQGAASYRQLALLYASKARPSKLSVETERLLTQVSSGPLVRARNARLRGDAPGALAALQPGAAAGQRVFIAIGILALLGLGIFCSAVILFCLRFYNLGDDIAAVTETPPAPVPWGIGVALAVVSLHLLLMGAIGYGLTQLFPQSGGDTKIVLATLGVIISAVIVIGGFLISLGKAPWDWSSLGWRQTPRGLGYGLLILVIVLPLVRGVTFLSSAIFHGDNAVNPIIPFVLQTRSIWVQLYLLLTVTVVAPLVEETLFRGILFRALNHRLAFWSAAVLSGFLFAIAHGELMAILPITLLGTVFAFLTQRSRSLLPSAAAHAGYNGLVSLNLFLLAWALRGLGG